MSPRCMRRDGAETSTLRGPQAKPLELNEVTCAAPYDASLVCGFLGRPGRESRGGGVTARYDRIVFPPTAPEGGAFGGQ